MSISTRTTSAWLGSLAHPPSSSPALDSKYSTVALTHGARRPRATLGFFEDGGHSTAKGNGKGSKGAIGLEEELRDLQGLGNEVDAAWSITIAEGPKSRSRSRKPDPSLTIYVSTPTSSLTLSRKTSEVVEFQSKLQSKFPAICPARHTSHASTATTTPKKRNVLASLTRTLSPRRSSQTSSHSSITSSRPASLVPLDLKDLSSILSKASTDPTLRVDPTWTTFFTTRKDDLESARIERRIKRARSDQTMHLGGTTMTTKPIGSSGQGGGGERMERQEVSGSTNEVIDTPPIFERGSYFPAGEPTTIRMEMEPDGGDDLNEDAKQAEKTDVIQEKEEEEEAVDDATNEHSASPSAISEDSKPTAVETATSNLPQPIDSSSLLHPTSSAPMARSISANSAISIDRRSKDVTIDSFDIILVLGKGCAGKVLLVRKKDTDDYYALKAITKRHVLAHRELDHTRTEQSVLKTCARDKSNPFIIQLHYSFRDADTLYLALSFESGGDLATQLARWGRLGRDRARFYMAEICEGVEGLHRAGIIYRDLKPENILLNADGHVVLTDFGLSKDFGHSRVTPPTATLRDELPRPHWLSAHPTQRSASTPPGADSWMRGRETTMSFCGTAEYLAPEVLLGEPYSYEVDAWSAGTMLYEMLAGVTPFFADDHATMYRRVLHEELTFEERASDRVFDHDTISFIRGMLQRDPMLRMSDARIKSHPYFSMIDWSHVYHKRYVPPFVPILNPHDPTDTSHFDDAFLAMPAQVEPDETELGSRELPEGEPQSAFDARGRDVFDGYSYYGRDSDSIDRFDMEYEGEEMTDGRAEVNQMEEVLNEHAVEKMLEDTPITGEPQTSTTSPSSTSRSLDKLDQHSSSDDMHGLDQSGMTNSDATLSSLATVSTQPTTAPNDSPAAQRRRQSSTRSSLEPVSEVPIASNRTKVVLEELEEVSDSDWDVVDVKDITESSRNGGREATLFSRGFRDTYRLVVAPLSTPLRSPQGMRNSSRVGSRKGSASSGRSSLVGTSISTTPEPPRSPSGILRFTSVRNKPKSEFLPSVASNRSLSVEPNHPRSASASPSSNGLTSPPSPRPPSSDKSKTKKGISASFSTSSLVNASSSPKRAGSSIKKLAKSAFQSNNNPHSFADTSKNP